MSEITTVAKLNCAKRELRMRHRVYPNRVRARSMTQEKADHEIAVIEAIVAGETAGVLLTRYEYQMAPAKGCESIESPIDTLITS